MDWLLLVLLLAAIIVPIVLLFGFAGCTYTPPVGRSTPTIVGATPLDAFTVELLWTDSNGVPATYEVERTKGMDLPSAPMPVTLMPLPGQPLRFVDNPLPGAGRTAIASERLLPAMALSPDGRFLLRSRRGRESSPRRWSRVE